MHDGGGDDDWSYKTCKAPLRLSPPTNQRPTSYKLDALPVAQPTVSEHWREKIYSRDLFYSSIWVMLLWVVSFIICTALIIIKYIYRINLDTGIQWPVHSYSLQVLKSNLAIEKAHYLEDSNMWIGPRQVHIRGILTCTVLLCCDNG